MVPVDDIRAQGLDVRVARYAPSENISIAMFSGGGIAFADAAMKRGEIAVPPAPPGAHPDLSGLSCRYEEIPASRGLVLSLVVAPAPGVERRSVPRRHRARRAYRGADAGRVAAGAGPAAPLHLAAGRRRPRGPRLAAARRVGARAQDQGAGEDVPVFPHHAFRHPGRQLHPGEIHPRADRQFGLPQVRRCAPHGARLHAGAGRRDRGASQGMHRQGHRALRHAPPEGRDDDVLHAVADAAPTTCISSTARRAAMPWLRTRSRRWVDSATCSAVLFVSKGCVP